MPVGAVIAEIGAAAAKADAPQQEERKDVQPNNSFIKISPSARRLAHTLGVDISKVKGTGPNGRIVHQDIQNYAEAANTVVEDREEIQQPQAEDHSPPQPQNMEIYQLNRIEAISGERMLHSLQSTAQLTMTRDVDVTDAVALLESVKKGPKG